MYNKRRVHQNSSWCWCKGDVADDVATVADDVATAAPYDIVDDVAAAVADSDVDVESFIILCIL